MGKLRVIELFAGIGSQHQALKNIGIPHEVVAISEIDRYAVASYEAMHGAVNNLGDITKIEHLPECDLLTYSFPCQDLSVVGHQNGMTKGTGTRSGLLWEVERLLLDMRERDVLPEVLLMENVDAILFEKNLPDFKKWINALTEMGYTSSYKVLNAADFGIPQRRMRCFMVSCKDGRLFQFPRPQPLTKCLRDLLEDDVPESYYLSEKSIESYVSHKKRHDALGHGLGWRPTEGEREQPTVLQPDQTRRELHHREGCRMTEDFVRWPSANRKGYELARGGGRIGNGKTIDRQRNGQKPDVPYTDDRTYDGSRSGAM